MNLARALEPPSKRGSLGTAGALQVDLQGRSGFLLRCRVLCLGFMACALCFISEVLVRKPENHKPSTRTLLGGSWVVKNSGLGRVAMISKLVSIWAVVKIIAPFWLPYIIGAVL